MLPIGNKISDWVLWLRPLYTTHGIFKKNRTCFPELESMRRRRMDESFTLKTQKEHHNKDNKWISDLNLKPITQVPLGVIHLDYLGVTKKLSHVC